VTVIELRDVRKVFNAGKTNEFTAVDGVSLTVEPRKATVFKGPSGSGKTTLLGLVGCMARPTSGRIRLPALGVPGIPSAEGSSVDVTSLPERFLTEIRRRTFGFIFQQFHLVKGITALENVMLPAFPLGRPRPALRDRALELLGLLGLSRQASSRVEWLSGGEAQRVAIARALINDPSVIIADEPTAHLDSKLSLELLGILAGLRTQGKTLLVASHDPLVYESALVDRIVEMRDGRIRDTGEAG
jgi:putative ABC transport system ATP-binding protein